MSKNRTPEVRIDMPIVLGDRPPFIYETLCERAHRSPECVHLEKPQDTENQQLHIATGGLLMVWQIPESESSLYTARCD